MKVYLVSTGCYSDYLVHAVYSTKELALEANKFFGNENEIEEFELDVLPDHPEGMYPFEVLIDQDGTAHRVTNCNADQAERYEWDRTPEWFPNTTDGYGFRTLVNQRFWIYRMWATDEKHAVKIANERRAMAIANNFAF